MATFVPSWVSLVDIAYNRIVPRRPHCPCRPRAAINRGVSPWPAVVFLAFFAVLIAFVSHYYLLPALSASQSATQPASSMLDAEATLVLSILLIILLSGLVLTFKVHRFFLPHPRVPRVRTKYVDAWAEAGRRAGDEK